MVDFCAIRDKPRLQLVAGFWFCTGIRMRWGVYEDVCIGVGDTLSDAYKRWKQD